MLNLGIQCPGSGKPKSDTITWLEDVMAHYNVRAVFVIFIATFSIFIVTAEKAQAITLCECKGHGGLEGVTLWGPENEFCGGIGGWGKYQNCREVSEIATCVGRKEPPSHVEGVRFWGPRGEPCAGKDQWGKFDAESIGADQKRICMCEGLGGVDGVKLWGPERFHCGGMSAPEWGFYDVSCR